MPEIKSVIFSMGALKSRGHDGLNAEFFQACWTTISEDFFKLIQDFFISHQMPSDINHTLLVLIAKKDLPQTVTDYRPISLCTIAYKTIAKIIANRLNVFFLIDSSLHTKVPSSKAGVFLIIQLSLKKQFILLLIPNEKTGLLPPR